MFIYLFNKYLLSANNVLGISLGIWDTLRNKEDKGPSFLFCFV